MQFEFRFRPVVTLLSAALVIVLAVLAFWQLGRFLEKSQLEDKWAQRQAAPPIAFDRLAGFDADALDYRQVEARGTLDTTHVVYYSERRFRGEPGCLVASPLKLAAGGTILVVRGFVPHTPDARCDEKPLTAPGDGELLALVHTVRPNLADPPNRAKATGPTLHFDTLDVDGTYTAWGIEDRPTTPTVLVLDEKHVGSPFPYASYEHVSAPYLTSMRHLNYAGTWFICILLVLGAWGGLCMRRVDPAPTESGTTAG